MIDILVHAGIYWYTVQREFVERETPMQTTTSRRIVTQRAEDLARLAGQAEHRGVRILLTADGEHFATSSSSAVTLHRVSPAGCDCRGFAYWGRCTHHSLLLAELGQLPAVEPAPVVVCPACGGRGVDPACHGHRVAGGVVTCPCERCQGAGTVAPTITERPARLAA